VRADDGVQRRWHASRAGTEYVPGVNEERALSDIKTMLEQHLESRLALFAEDGGVLAG